MYLFAVKHTENADKYICKYFNLKIIINLKNIIKNITDSEQNFVPKQELIIFLGEKKNLYFKKDNYYQNIMLTLPYCITN